jgi:hypothetical protein
MPLRPVLFRNALAAIAVYVLGMVTTPSNVPVYPVTVVPVKVNPERAAG